MRCANCGAELNENARFCGNCGAAVMVEAPQAAEETQEVTESTAAPEASAAAETGNVKPVEEEIMNTEPVEEGTMNMEPAGEAAGTTEPVEFTPVEGGNIQVIAEVPAAEGTVIEETAATENTAPETVPDPTIETAVEAAASSEPVGQAAANESKVPEQPVIPKEYKPLGAWGYFGLSLLYGIPLIGLIFVLIFSFGGTDNVNLRSFSRGVFIVKVFSVVISVVIAILIATALSTGLDSAFRALIGLTSGLMP